MRCEIRGYKREDEASELAGECKREESREGRGCDKEKGQRSDYKAKSRSRVSGEYARTRLAICPDRVTMAP